jgi:hypothetical protein
MCFCVRAICKISSSDRSAYIFISSFIWATTVLTPGTPGTKKLAEENFPALYLPPGSTCGRLELAPQPMEAPGNETPQRPAIPQAQTGD